MNDGAPTLDWLRARALATPDAPALFSGDASWTYGRLDALVDAWTGRLAALALQPGDLLGVLLPNGLDYACLVHAAARRGLILLPLNTRLTPAELRWQLEHTGCALLLHDDATAATAAALAAPQRRIVNVADLPQGAAALPEPLRLDRPQAIVFTSGTTGHPKGVALTFANHFWSAAASAMRLGTLPTDRWLSCLPLYHVGGLAILFRAALYGISVDLHPRFDTAAVSRALDETPLTLISLVPTMVQRLLDQRGDRPWAPTLRHVLVGGAAADPALLTRCQALGIPIAPTYGLTEAASQVATMVPADAARKPGSVGRPLLFSRIEIRDEAGKPLPPETPGEIHVSGPTVMTGYYRDPAATEAALADGWLRTGDVGFLDADGDLWLLQRRSDIIVSGGENVYPAEVERVLRTHPAVADVCVVGVPSPEWGQAVAAQVVVRPEQSLLPADLLAYGRSQLAGYKLPRRLQLVDALPLTASGKVHRRAVAAALAGADHAADA